MVSVFWVGACGCFLVPACVCCPVVGWWVWVRCGVGHKAFLASMHTVGFTFNTVLASAIAVVVACIAC